jgi:hypothetical protein
MYDLEQDCFALASCWAYSSTLKMEATCSYEMLVDFQRTIRRYIPEEIPLQDCFDSITVSVY